MTTVCSPGVSSVLFPSEKCRAYGPLSGLREIGAPISMPP
eukprot:CAMPEP_0174722838 /NCGR_PEP_ID=MMETSP1094-20130205/39398_1 /TAXON_ID=156173 /ORGANISM="Chrysochromulina brevifilum, Strain UTEX LB 985" /LENGTH=39 /DNA_ID= /DNA_START= /DNA_END= /DNA_ORIENTATION=